MEVIASKNKPAANEPEEKPAPKTKTGGNTAAKEKNVKQGKVDDSVAKKMADINAKSKTAKDNSPSAASGKSASKTAASNSTGKKKSNW